MKIKTIISLIGLLLLAVLSVAGYFYFIDQSPSKAKATLPAAAPVLPPALESAVVDTGKSAEPPVPEIDLSKKKLSAQQIQKKEEEYYQKFQQLVEEVSEFIDSTGQESPAVAKPEKSVSDTLTIMAQQESDEEKAKRLALEEQCQQEAKQKSPVVVSKEKEVLLYGDMDTAWVDERLYSLPDTIVSYQYTYGKRTVKRVEYSVCWGDTSILREFFLQALKKEIEKLKNCQEIKQKLVFTVRSVENQQQGLQVNQVNNDQVNFTIKELKYSFRFTYISDVNVEYSQFINKIMRDLSLIDPLDFPIVKVIIELPCHQGRWNISFDVTMSGSGSDGFDNFGFPEALRCKWFNQDGSTAILQFPREMYSFSFLINLTDSSVVTDFLDVGIDYGRYRLYQAWGGNGHRYDTNNFIRTKDIYCLFLGAGMDIKIPISKKINICWRLFEVKYYWSFNNNIDDISVSFFILEHFFNGGGSRLMAPVKLTMTL